MSKQRAAVFVFYDKDGIVDRYKTYMLKEIQKVCSKLVIVCNGELDDEGRLLFSGISNDIIVRENEGFDAWGFKTGLDHIGWEELDQYDELVLMNDTVFGPFYPFQTIFEEMEDRGLDFWGITKHGQIGDPYGLTMDGIFPEHIQSYFFAINKRMFTSTGFIDYWDDLPEFKSWKDAVSLHEVQFTRHFTELGFSWDVYVDTDEGLKGVTGTCLLELMTYELLKNNKLPVIKRKNFATEYDVVLGTTVGDSTRKAFEYIHNNTGYDVDLIWENILRTTSLRVIKDNLDLVYALPDDYVLSRLVDQSGQKSPGDVKVALCMLITYEDQVEFCADYANSILPSADIYVTTLTEDMKEKLQRRFTDIKCNKLEVIVLPENHKGRDVSALWVALKPYIREYDYICFTHNKKSTQDKPYTIGRGFAQRCFGNLLASRAYVENVVDLFEKNPRLGMLFPPPVTHGPYKSNISHHWGMNYKNTVNLGKKLGINVPIDDKDPVFPAGGMFWFRTKALKRFIDEDWKYEDFASEPMPFDGTISHAFERLYCYAAQSEGYYSGWVMTVENASTEITSLSYLLMQWYLHDELG